MFILPTYRTLSWRMFKSLKNRLLAWFLLLAFAVAFTVFPLNYFREKRQRKILNTVYELNDVQIQLLKEIKNTGDILTDASTNSQFYISGESPYLSKHNKISDSLKNYFARKISLEHEGSVVDSVSWANIDRSYSSYCQILDSIIYYIYKRGYRDFGLEGEMISYIYKAEKFPGMKRRTYDIKESERDYLSRNDSVYVPLLNQLVDQLIANIANGNAYTVKEKAELVTLLKNYKQSFNKLVRLDYKIGIKTKTGLMNKLNKAGDKLEASVVNAIDEARSNEQKQIADLNLLFALLSILILVGAIVFSLYLSRYTVSHLELLTRYIAQIAQNNFTFSKKLNLRNSSLEIREIYKEFRNMVAQIKIREKQRDKALADVKNNEHRFRELADLLPQCIFEADKLGNLVYVNKAWLSNFEYSMEELQEGLNLIEILNTDANTPIFGSDKLENSDFIAIRKSGTRFPATVYADNIIRNGEIIGRRGIIIDSTLRNKYIETLKKETLRAITSDKHKSSFLANMSHEIRTPMNSIIGFANLLTAPQIPEEQKKDYIRYIQSSGQILLNLIDDIIDVAKIEAGEIRLKPIKCNPVRIIDELVKTFEGYKSSIGKEHLMINSKVPIEEIYFRTDAFRLRQVLTNLISNALKFTEEGSVTLTLNVKNDRFLEFSVEDTGIGLTKEELKQIFERFRRSKTSENKNITGTGLGLSIAKSLVELLGGQMWVSSQPSLGTRFWFTLPYIRIPDESGKYETQDNVTGSEVYNWSGKTILIAEDDDNSYVFLKELLGKTNVRLVRAINGKEVVEAVKMSDQIDIILMDIQMPYLDGYEATKEIKEIRPKLPVIAQTAFAMEGDKEKSIMIGCDDYITKPIQPLNLMAKISQFLTEEKTTPKSQEEKQATSEDKTNPIFSSRRENQ